MKVLFVHDHIFSKSITGEVYSAAAFPQHAWDRYLEFFNSIIVVGRGGGVAENTLELVLSSREEVEFDFVPKLSISPSFLKKRKLIINKLRKHVSEANAVVVRLPSENGIIAFELARTMKKPVAVEIVGCVWEALWNHGSILAKLYAPLAFWRMRRTIQKSNLSLYVTQKFLQDRYPSAENAVVASASNVEIEIPCKDYVVNRSWNKNKIVIGLIGNYKTKYKGIHSALEALGKLRGKLDNFEFRVLGRGDPTEYLKLAENLEINDRVFFDGGLPNGEPVMRWLDGIDIYLQPSLTEGLPRALIEAMSRGCVCLGSNVGGIPELLSKEFMHQAGNADELAGLLIKITNQRSKWSQISLSNYESAIVYNKDYLAVKRSQFYSKLCLMRG